MAQRVIIIMDIEKRHIILASRSPRRSDILKKHGVKFTVASADIDEDVEFWDSPKLYCMSLAVRKAFAVREEGCEGIIISADTIVVHDGKILGKPADDADAYATLKSLKADMHQVMTGVAICDTETGITDTFCEVTDVYFTDYTDKDILDYVATGEPADKAGSYAIQGAWRQFVDRIEGDYSNVVGLPWDALLPILEKHIYSE